MLAPPPSAPSRLLALDAVRAAAMLLGVVLHAAAAYMQVPLRGLIMPVQEYAASRFPDTVFWTLHAFRVPMFFVVAGLFARDALARKTPGEFFKSRWRRLGIPLLIAYPILAVAMQPVWLWGWVDRGWASWGHLFSLQYGPELERAVWGLYHLWFLEYLLAYSVIVWAISHLVRRGKAGTSSETGPDASGEVRVVRTGDVSFGEQSAAVEPQATKASSAWRLVPLALVAVALGAWIFSADASWYLDFHNSFFPRPLPFAFYSIHFALGFVLRRHWLKALATISPILLLVAAACLAPMLQLIASSVWQTDHGPRQGRLTESASDRLMLGVLVSTIAVLGSLGIVGLAILLIRRSSRFSRFLVDAAYWVFLTHLVWVGVGVMVLHKVAVVASLRPEFKMIIVAGFAGIVSVATFIPVRATRVGRWLGAGRRTSA